MKMNCIFILLIFWFNSLRISFIFGDNLTSTGYFAFKVFYFLSHVIFAIFCFNRFYNSKEEQVMNNFNQVFEYHVNNDNDIAYLRKRINFFFISLYSGTPLSEHLGVTLKMFGNHEMFGKESFYK